MAVTSARPLRHRIPARLRLFLISLCLSLLLGSCQSASLAPSRPVTISIGGATAMLPVLQELTEEFHRRQPTVFFDLRGGGSQYGEDQTLAGRLNLGASTFPPPAAENARPAQERRPGPIDTNLVRTPIGIDALALIVHRTNPIEDLSAEQVAMIFTGRILNWAELGGVDGEIVLVSREDGSGARRAFEERIMESASVSLTAVVMPTSRDVVEYVAKTPNAIGYVSRGYVVNHLPQAGRAPNPTEANATGAHPTGAHPTVAQPEVAQPQVRVVGLDGMWPVDAAIQNQLYSLSYPIYLVSRREPSGALRQFIDFILSPAGQAIVGQYHVRVR